MPLPTQCDGGSALHEAAVCGKDETVELLLDKGVNLDLKDGRDRTVLDILNEYTAEKAVKIKTRIQGEACNIYCGAEVTRCMQCQQASECRQ